MRYPFKCDDDSFEGIFSEHVLEHFYVDDARRILQECFRVLKPRGCIRLSIPDVSQCVRDYLKAKERVESAHLAAECVRLLTQEFLHLSVWDFERLAYELESVGFVEVRQCGFREGSDSNMLFDLESRSDESFYIEGKKP
ncbi:class I SAM-dependent methyltransferase [uncultured Helicobacter sp.]|uniref:class I SAM-dependent methyltransferase n=1 Tax=uncultured Helicobacter sp. TaxID=175537 RepID=UPI003751BE99